MAVADFDIKRFVLEPIFESKDTSAQQYNAFPKYKYSTKKDAEVVSSLRVVTKPIKMVKGGIPTVDTEYRKTNEDCLYIWLPFLENDENGKDLYEKVFYPLDKLCHERINVKKNDGFLTVSEGKGKEPMKLTSLDYNPMVNKTKPPKNQSGGNDDESYEGQKFELTDSNSQLFYRTKIRLDVERDPKDPKKVDEHKIVTEVWTNDENGVPGKKALSIKSLDDLRQYFRFGCEAQFILKFTKLWASRTVMKKVRGCGISVKCTNIYITKPSTSRGFDRITGLGAFGITQVEDDDEETEETEKVEKSKDDSEDESKTTKSTKKKSDDSSESEASSDSESESKSKSVTKKATKDDSESEEETTKKTPAKKTVTKKATKDDSESEASSSSSESESESSSESESDKKAKGKKPVKGSKSKDDSESEEESKKKPTKKSK